MLSTTAKRTLATVLSVAIAGTIGVPAATAMPADNVGPAHPSDTQVAAPPQRPDTPSATDATPSGGFDVSSAAIGAGAGTGLLIVTFAAGGLAWRQPMTRRHGAADA